LNTFYRHLLREWLQIRWLVLLATCGVLVVPQVVVVALLAQWGMLLSAVFVSASVIGQIALMPRLVADPAARAPWYGATGVSLYVTGMLAAALGLGGHI